MERGDSRPRTSDRDRGLDHPDREEIRHTAEGEGGGIHCTTGERGPDDPRPTHGERV